MGPGEISTPGTGDIVYGYRIPVDSAGLREGEVLCGGEPDGAPSLERTAWLFFLRVSTRIEVGRERKILGRRR